MNERRYPALVGLLGLVATCTGMAGLRWLSPFDSSFSSAVCCPMLGMKINSDTAFFMAALFRSAFFAYGFYGLGVLFFRSWKTYRFVASLRHAAVATLPERLTGISAELGLDGQVIAIAAPNPLAFCFGLLRPRICVSLGLIETLTDAELRAVLLHEDHHRRRFDPLRGLAAESLAALFGFLPIVGELRDMALTQAELSADRHAVRYAGRPPLAGALHKILTHPRAIHLPSAVGVSGLSATETRIAHLLGDQNSALRLSAHSLLITSALLIAICMILQLPAL